MASGVESGIIKYPNMATTTENIINSNPATANLLRLNAFQVRCVGVSSAKCVCVRLAKDNTILHDLRILGLGRIKFT